MTFRDIIVLTAVAALLVFAVCRIIKSRKRGVCCGDCSYCTGCKKK